MVTTPHWSPSRCPVLISWWPLKLGNSFALLHRRQEMTFAVSGSTGTESPLFNVPPSFLLLLPSGSRTQIPTLSVRPFCPLFSSAETAGFLSPHFSLFQPWFSLPSSSGTPTQHSARDHAKKPPQNEERRCPPPTSLTGNSTPVWASPLEWGEGKTLREYTYKEGIKFSWHIDKVLTQCYTHNELY